MVEPHLVDDTRYKAFCYLRQLVEHPRGHCRGVRPQQVLLGLADFPVVAVTL